MNADNIVRRRVAEADLRWDCKQEDKCFITHMWPNKAALASYLPASMGGCRPGDIDATIERNGHFLFVEYKSKHWGGTLARGQHIYYSRLSKVPGFTVIFVQGLGWETDPITGMGEYVDGEWSGLRPVREPALKLRVQKWAEMAESDLSMLGDRKIVGERRDNEGNVIAKIRESANVGF